MRTYLSFEINGYVDSYKMITIENDTILCKVIRWKIGKMFYLYTYYDYTIYFVEDRVCSTFIFSS